MVDRGIATFGLDTGKCPPWLWKRMVKLGLPMIEIMVEEFGSDEFVRRMANPAWFQSLGTVLAFDWNASGLTTILTAALREALIGREKELGIFICGGKGKHSRKTPDEILAWGAELNFSEQSTQGLIYNSKMSAKVDSSLVQDGFQLYHHAFFFSKNGHWTVVQQGMNTDTVSARRYHWHSEDINDLVIDPHTGISSEVETPTLNLASEGSRGTQELSVEMTNGGYKSLWRDVEMLHRHATELSQVVDYRKDGVRHSFLNLEKKEFAVHPVIKETFTNSKYLEKILQKVTDVKPTTYEELVSLPGVGAKTVRALSLVSEVIYGATPSYEDPARYSFAHGGKDATPYPVDRATYDQTIEFFTKVVKQMKIPREDKLPMLKRLDAKFKDTEYDVPF